MTALLSPPARQQFFIKGTNTPAAGYRVYTYATGTTTPLAAYKDRNRVATHTNPIILDADGYVPDGLFLELGRVYDYSFQSPTGDSQWTQPGISVADALAELANPDTGASLAAFKQTGTGAVTRSSRAKHLERISFEDYGAVGDGVADDTLAIQRAIDAHPGKDIHACSSKYRLTASLSIVNAVRLHAPKGGCELQMATPNTDTIVIGNGTSAGAATSLGTVIDGFTFAPVSGLAACTTGSCIFVNWSAFFDIRNCDFYGKDGTGAKLFRGVTLFRASDGFIRHCRARHFLSSGFYGLGSAGGGTPNAYRTVDVRIQSCRVYGNGGHQIHLGAHCNGIFLDDPIVLDTGNFAGIYIDADPSTEDGSNFFIVNPNVEGGNYTSGDGIVVNKGQNVQIVGGWIGGILPARSGIHFAAGASSCEAHGTQLDASPVRIDGPACSTSNLRVSGFNTAASAYYVSGTATGFVIEGGRARQCTGAAIAISGSPVNGRITGVTFQNNGSSVSGSSYAAGPTISGCRSDAPTAYTAAATLAIANGVDFIQVSGATTIVTLGENGKGRRLTIQAGSGGITFGNTGNLLLKGGVASFALTAFRSVSFVCDGTTWFQDGDSN